VYLSFPGIWEGHEIHLWTTETASAIRRNAEVRHSWKSTRTDKLFKPYLNEIIRGV